MEVILNGKPVDLSSRPGRRFLKDFYKTMQQKLTVAELRLKYQITAETIKHLADDPVFIDAVRASQEKRKSDAPETLTTAGNVSAAASNVVELHPQPPRFEENLELVQDLARYAEGSLTEQQVRKKYCFDDGDWEKMGGDDLLVRAIDAEKIRRLRDGSAKRDLAQLHIVKAPAILDSIMSDVKADNKHRVDAIKTLDAIASPPAQMGGGDSSRFIISISMGSETVTFNKSRTPVVDDPDDDSNTTLTITQETNNDGQEHF